MTRNVFCHEGKCFDTETKGSVFDYIFDDSNIVDQIHKDLVHHMF